MEQRNTEHRALMEEARVARISRLLNFYSMASLAIFSTFAVLMVIRGRTDLAIGLATSAVLILLYLLFFRHVKKVDISSVVTMVVAASGLLWVIYCDRDRQSPYYWTLLVLLPPVFMFGHIKGLIFNLFFAVPVMLLASITAAQPWIAEADPVFLVRFAVSFVGVLTFAYIFERSRFRTQTKLEEEILERQRVQAELQESLQQVKVLSGFLPICASCKKIRDDQGYWKQIEGYISEHSEVEFSHGICEQCAVELYGDIGRPKPEQDSASDS